MPTKSMTLFSLNVLKDYVGVKGDSKDAQLTRIADAVSERIESFTRRKFTTQSVVELITAQQDGKLFLRHFPVNSVTQVRTKQWQGDAFVVVPTSDWELDAPHGVLYALWQPFPSGIPNGVEVTYSVGYGLQDTTTLPQDVVQAGLDWARYIYQRQSSGLTAVSSATVAGASVTISAMPKDVKDALDPWRKVRL